MDLFPLLAILGALCGHSHTYRNSISGFSVLVTPTSLHYCSADGQVFKQLSTELSPQPLLGPACRAGTLSHHKLGLEPPRRGLLARGIKP